jgi:hypothetical protein
VRIPSGGEERIANELWLKLGIHVSPRTMRAYWPTGHEVACQQPSGVIADKYAPVLRMPKGPRILAPNTRMEEFESIAGLSVRCTLAVSSGTRDSYEDRTISTQYQCLLVIGLHCLCLPRRRLRLLRRGHCQSSAKLCL